MPEELLEVVDENDKVIGSATRAMVHQQGLLHREIHVWVVRGGEVLFQRRSPTKDTNPNMLDASVGGHVGIRQTYREAAVRELEEEIGLRISPDDLVLLEKRRGSGHDPVTNTTNNRFREIFAVRVNSNRQLKLEDNEATSLEYWEFDRLRNLTPTEAAEFTSGCLEECFSLLPGFIEQPT